MRAVRERDDGLHRAKISSVVHARWKWVVDERHELTFGHTGDVALDSANVSRVHCAMIVNEAGCAWVEDRGSSNGTFVDGQRIDRARFAVGQRLHVGNFRIQLVEPPHVPASFDDA